MVKEEAKIKINPVYVVTMYRWGNRESHSYVLGAYHKKHLALKKATEEQDYRGGNKYYPEVVEFDARGSEHEKVIMSLEDAYSEAQP